MRKLVVSLLISSVILGLVGCGNSTDTQKLNDTILEQKNTIKDMKAENAKLTKEKAELDSKVTDLQQKVDEAAPWFEMKEEERKAEEQKLAE